MRRTSSTSSTTSLLSLVSLGNSNEASSQRGKKSSTESRKYSFVPLLDNIRGNLSRVTSSGSFTTLGSKRSSLRVSNVTKKQNPMTRNSKSMTSLKSLEKESSAPLSYSDLLTPSALLTFREIDSSLEEIGNSALGPESRELSSSTICELSEHDGNDSLPIFIESDSPIGNPLTSVSKSRIQRVCRGDFHQICKIGSGVYSDVYMVLDYKREKCALKVLNPSRLDDSETFIMAALDLAMEARILSELDHENIIQLRGVCSSRFSASYMEGAGGGYFLVLDLLEDVLSDRLNRWRKDNHRLSAFETKWNFGKTRVNTQAMYGRMRDVALGIVKGMIYLHENGIVIRDLKPANVGFNDRGLVQLFDFGMARNLEDCNPHELCGSPRYMPPEVMDGKGYSFEADVYSFGIILYEICSLNVAFDNIRKCSDRNEFYRLVIEDHARPKLNNIACPLTKQLISDCWQCNPTQRPSFKQVYQRIEGITDGKN